MKIYTKTGDSGTTSLFGGRRVNKDDLRIKAYGSVDELNSIIGLVASQSEGSATTKKLVRVQGELMVLGSDLSAPLELKIKVPRVNKLFVLRLEREIDTWDKKLPRLKNFILPGGVITSAQLHTARSVSRRAERAIVMLANTEAVNKNAVIYINRLSDWLFTFARYVNYEAGVKDVIWKGRGK